MRGALAGHDDARSSGVNGDLLQLERRRSGANQNHGATTATEAGAYRLPFCRQLSRAETRLATRMRRGCSAGKLRVVGRELGYASPMQRHGIRARAEESSWCPLERPSTASPVAPDRVAAPLRTVAPSPVIGVAASPTCATDEGWPAPGRGAGSAQPVRVVC